MGVLIRTGSAFTALLTLLLALPSPAYAADGERLAFRIVDPRITESSGLAVSPGHEGIVYTHNDSDAGATVYALGPKGRTRATFSIGGAEARDWEGMATSTDPKTGRGVLWLADIGDNLDGAWSDISVYRVLEPTAMADATLPATRYRFRYADGARNAEGIMVDPRTSRLYIVSKEFAASIYRAPAKLRTGRPNILRKVGPAPLMATDAAYSPDGSSFIIRTYFSATLYSAPGKSLGRVTMPSLSQAESITYTRDGTALLTGSEGKRSPVYEVPLPAGLLPQPTTAASPSARPVAPASRRPRPSAASHDAAAARETDAEPISGTSRALILAGLAIAAGVATVIVLIARRTR
jgi:hypothetical protein